MTYQRYFTEEHQMLRQSLRRFVQQEIMPHVDEWEEAGEFPRELYLACGRMGILSIGFPEAYGGSDADIFSQIVVWEELMRAGSGGLVAGLGSHTIALPPIVNFGDEQQKQRFLPPVLRGEKIAALAITEPSGGSDVANLQTRAVRQGDSYVVNGSKTFITSGCRADIITTAVRTGEPGARGITLLVVEGDMAGLSRSRPLKKMGWWASDTAQLYFDDVIVPVENRIGPENGGFYLIMDNFQMERLNMAIMANVTAELALDACCGYVKQRHAFDRPLAGFQTIRHQIVEMATRLDVSREYVYRVAAKMAAGEDQVTEISMAKLFATDMCDFVVDRAVQIFGGYGYMRESLVERLYRDSRILSIGGGTSEIMREIIAKRLM